jgi:ATP-dependent helicase HrpB
MPVESSFPEILNALRGPGCAVLTAPPGSGKTTRVPLLLMEALEGSILVLEPRRVAARAAARYMAWLLGESAGMRIGYRTRLESRVGRQTRVEVITEGVLTRRLLDDPELAGVSCVVFDEFHERSLQSDTSLAFCLESRQALRPDLMLLVMSATMDAAPVSRLLGGCPVIRAEGRLWPVEARYSPCPAPLFSASGRASAALLEHVARTVRRALAEEQGSILVFLPGQGEIRRVAEMLGALPQGAVLRPLYGDLSPEEQDEAIAPAPPGTRKVVLATSIAETSLTIEGVRVVIDAGLSRTYKYAPALGMGSLCTERVTQDSADQRAGRAGRTAPGTCIRLWQEGDVLLPRRRPEMLEADLAPFLLQVLAWGAGPGELAFLDLPPRAALDEAEQTLSMLGAVERAQGRLRLTAHGRALLRLPLHPRLAHMLLGAGGHGHLAAALAALAEDRPQARTVDIRPCLAQALRSPALRREASRLHALAGGAGSFSAERAAGDEDAAGGLISLSWPERLAKKKGRGEFLLASGRLAVLPPDDPLAGEEWLAAAALDGGTGGRSTIWLAAPIDEGTVRRLHASAIRTLRSILWDSRSQAVEAVQRTMLGSIVLEEKPLPQAQCPSGDHMRALLSGIAGLGLSCLPWTDRLRQWQARVALLRSLEGVSWPDVSDRALLSALEEASSGAADAEACWLTPWLDGIARRSQFGGIDLGAALHAMLPWDLRKRLDEEAPERMAVPSGSLARIDYVQEGGPALTVKLQEMFGQKSSPAICGGRVPLVVHLLSPAGRPLQITRDLAHFWQEGYAAVRAEMRGRYPRHPWPEDPLQAQPTKKTSRALAAAGKKE